MAFYEIAIVIVGALFLVLALSAGCAASARGGSQAQQGVVNLAAASAPAQLGAVNTIQTMVSPVTAPPAGVAGAAASQPAAGEGPGRGGAPPVPDLIQQQGAANASVQGNTGIAYYSAVGVGGVVLFALSVYVVRRCLRTVDHMADKLHASQPCGGGL